MLVRDKIFNKALIFYIYCRKYNDFVMAFGMSFPLVLLSDSINSEIVNLGCTGKYKKKIPNIFHKTMNQHCVRYI